MTARVYKFTTANTNNLQNIGAGKVVGASLINTVAAPYYVKLWWTDQAPTVGTTAPDLVIAVPALDVDTGAAGSVCVSWPGGAVQGTSAVWVACVTGAADNNNTAVASGQGVVNLLLE
jgi:hypothetical protein